MELKAALFDLDGTLLDTERQYSLFWKRMERKYHASVVNVADNIRGTSLNVTLQHYFPQQSECEQILQELQNYELEMNYAFYPGAVDFLNDLRSNGVKCAVVTSSKRPKMEHVATHVEGFNQLFDAVLTSEDFVASKPQPDCYLLGAHTFGCQPSECVVFEDAFPGLQAGRAAKMFTVGLATTNSRESIMDKCDYVIDNYVGLTYNTLLQIVNGLRF